MITRLSNSSAASGFMLTLLLFIGWDATTRAGRQGYGGIGLIFGPLVARAGKLSVPV